MSVTGKEIQNKQKVSVKKSWKVCVLSGPQRKDGVVQDEEAVTYKAMGVSGWSAMGTGGRWKEEGAGGFPSLETKQRQPGTFPIVFQAADKAPNIMEPPLPSATSKWATLDGSASFDNEHSPGELSIGNNE